MSLVANKHCAFMDNTEIKSLLKVARVRLIVKKTLNYFDCYDTSTILVIIFPARA